VAYYILNVADADRERAAELLRAGKWGVDADELHGEALGAGDLALVYLGAPRREFIGRAELASPVDAARGVLLTHVEEWDPPVLMDVVLSRLDPSAKARADFDTGVVRITEHEYETVLALAAGQ
jgi:hypothetical protein